MEIHYFIVVLTILLTSKALAQNYTTEDPLQSCYKPYSCLNCTAARICRPNPNGDGTFIDYKDFNCTGSTPFCNEATGTCSAKASSDECEVTSAVLGEHVCMKDGVFPHPTLCKKYFRCKNLTSISYNCSRSYDDYDAIKEECTYSASCTLVSCSGYNGYKRAYRMNNRNTQIFAYCVNGVAAVMDKCDGKYVLNETTQVCEPVCSYPGLIEDISDCRRYYQCDPTSSPDVFERTSHICPQGFGFSQRKYQCVTLDKIPSCRQTFATHIKNHDVLSILVSITTASTIVDQEVSAVDSPRAVCDKTYSCANCTAARICRPDPNVTGAFITYDVACSSYIPYCDEQSGTCTSKIPFACLNNTSYIEGEFMCLKNGMFPHPLSNRRYFECRNYTSYTYNCTGPYYYRYNPVDEECNNHGNYYYFGSCSGYNGLKKAYTPSQFYAYCINSEVALMDKCDGNYRLNETSQMCEPVCEYPGLIEDATNCRKYYKCRTKTEYSYQSKFERTSHTCRDGFGFSQEDFQCVPLESIPWCKQSTTKDIGLLVDTEQDNKQNVIHNIPNLSQQDDDHQLQ